MMTKKTTFLLVLTDHTFLPPFPAWELDPSSSHCFLLLMLSCGLFSVSILVPASDVHAMCWVSIWWCGYVDQENLPLVPGLLKDALSDRTWKLITPLARVDHAAPQQTFFIGNHCLALYHDDTKVLRSSCFNCI